MFQVYAAVEAKATSIAKTDTEEAKSQLKEAIVLLEQAAKALPEPESCTSCPPRNVAN